MNINASKRKEEYQKQREHEQATLEIKLREQYNKVEEEIKRNEQLRKRATEQAAKARVLGLQRKPSVSIDITAQLNRLRIMHSKLEEGRKTLEREEEARKRRVPGGEEDELCALCKKEDEIFKLESEIVRVHQRMQTTKCVQQPGCIESLQFEITRLRQEVQRRRALLLEMISEAKENAKQYQDQIDACQSKPNGGCPKAEEWQLRLQLKRVQDMLRRMEKRETERTILRIYKCLYEHREVKVETSNRRDVCVPNTLRYRLPKIRTRNEQITDDLRSCQWEEFVYLHMQRLPKRTKCQIM